LSERSILICGVERRDPSRKIDISRECESDKEQRRSNDGTYELNGNYVS